MKARLLLELLVAFTSQCLLTSHAFRDFVPITVCEEFVPHHGDIKGQPIAASPFSIHVNSTSYMPGDVITVTINGTRDFKGFLVQARSVGDPRPVGNFQGALQANTTYVWCAGGEPKNTIAHIHARGVSWSSLEFTWRAPESAKGNITFWTTMVDNFTTFYPRIQSRLVTGPPAAPEPNVTLGASFPVSKEGCGTTKGCYSEPENCTNSADCSFLVTYKTEGNNVTFEMSGKAGFVAVGFNSKQEMDETESIICTSGTGAVEVRHYYLDYHQPIRTDLRGSSDIVYHAGAYEEGITTCRFSRKRSVLPPTIIKRNLTDNWFFIFAWGGSHIRTGGIFYHFENASFSAQRVNVTQPMMLKNGRRTAPAPTPDGALEITKTGCAKTKSCYSEPSDCSSSGDCNYLVTYKPCGDGDDVEFELSAKSGWAAIGFNTKNKMDGTDTIICSRTSDDAVGVAHYTLDGYKTPMKTNPTPTDLNVVAGAYDGGVVRCRFSRKKTSSDMLNLDEEVFLLFARGPVTGNVLGKHTHKTVTTDKVDVCSLSAGLEGESKNLNLLRAHGILMIIAWVGFATIAMFVARYMKKAWGELFGKKAWFQVHRFLTISCFVFTIVGFILVFVYVTDWSKDAGAHAILGVIVTVLVCVQPTMAAFRPAPTHERRYIFNWAHRSVGFSALILSVVNIFLGVRLPHLNIVKTGVYIMIVYCVGLALVVVLELVLLIRRKSFKKYNPPTVKGNTKREEIEVVEPSSTPQNDSVLRTCVLLFLSALVSGVCLALIVFIVKETEQQ